MQNYIEIGVRYCGHGDWLGVAYFNGREVFRSGKHLRSRDAAWASATTWADENNDICGVN